MFLRALLSGGTAVKFNHHIVRVPGSFLSVFYFLHTDADADSMSRHLVLRVGQEET
jgi:hypothetical protein